MSAEATIKLKRRWNLVAGLSKFRLFVDNKKLGTVNNGKTELFKISPGTHSIYIKGLLWSKSRVLEIQTVADSTMVFECGIARSYLVILACLIVLLIVENVLISSPAHHPHSIGLFFACLVVVLAIIATIYSFRPNSVYDLKEIKEDTIVN